jgi:hypothetical protein
MNLLSNTKNSLTDKKKDPIADLTVSKSGTVTKYNNFSVYQDTSIRSKCN